MILEICVSLSYNFVIKGPLRLRFNCSGFKIEKRRRRRKAHAENVGERT